MKPINSSKNIIITSVISLLVVCTGYLLYKNNKTTDQRNSATENLQKTETAMLSVKDDYNASLARLDALKTENVGMDSLVSQKDEELNSLKVKIEKILSKEKATSGELAEVQNLVKSLNTKLSFYEEQISKLKESNANLATEKEKVTQENSKLAEEKSNIAEQNKKMEAEKKILSTEKENLKSEKDILTKEKQGLSEDKASLESKVELAKVISVANINLKVNKKSWLTGKIKSTDKSKRAENFTLNFDLTDNRISETGEKQLYIIIYGPDGNSYENGKFKLSNGTEKQFTISKLVPYVQGQGTKNIVVDWKPIGDKFQKGEYNIEIYHLGYKVGNEKVNLQ